MEKVVCFDLWNEMYKELVQLMSMNLMDDIRFFTQDGLAGDVSVWMLVNQIVMAMKES